MGRRGITWKTPDISANKLKLFGFAMLLAQSIGTIIVEKGLIRLDQYTAESLNQALASDSSLMMLAGIGSLLQLLGGLAVPVFPFLLVEGFRNTGSRSRYVLAVLGFALISEPVYDYAMTGSLMDPLHQNPLIAMTVSLLMLCCLDSLQAGKGILGSAARLCVVIAAVLWVTLLRAEYGLCVVLLAAVFYLFYARPVLKTALGAAVSLLYVTGPLAFYGLWCYDGRRNDRFSKYIYYASYPAQLLVLGVITRVFLLRG